MLTDGDVHLTAGGKTAVLATGLETERWYHVIVVHSRAKLTLEKKANANVRPRRGCRPGHVSVPGGSGC